MTDIVPSGINGPNSFLEMESVPSRSTTKGIPEDNRQPDEIQLQKACSEMESLFLNHLLQKMRSTIEKSDLFGGGQTEELYTSMLDGEIARNLAKAGGIGLAGVLQQQLEMARISSAAEAEEVIDAEDQQPVKTTRDSSGDKSGSTG